MKEIPLPGGFFAVVDDEDFGRVSAHKWYINMPYKRPYAVGYVPTREGKRVQGMHRFILGLTSDDLHVDHINGVPLDNRKSNLRLVTPRQNQWNRRPAVGYKGVFERSGNYQARIRIPGRYVVLGTFQNEAEAVQVYDAAATILRGEYARLNFDHIPADVLDRAREVLVRKGAIGAVDAEEVA